MHMVSFDGHWSDTCICSFTCFLFTIGDMQQFQNSLLFYPIKMKLGHNSQLFEVVPLILQYMQVHVPESRYYWWTCLSLHTCEIYDHGFVGNISHEDFAS